MVLELELAAFQQPDTNFTAVVIGASGSGKTSTIVEFIEKSDKLLPAGQRNHFLFIYNLNKPDLEATKDRSVVFKQGLPSLEEILRFKEEHQKKGGDDGGAGGRLTLIFDDALSLFQSLGPEAQNRYSALFTEHGRRGFSIFFVMQDVYPARLHNLVPLIRKNATYTIFFGFPNDLSSILLLASRQFGREYRASFREAYIEATSRKNGYLVADNNIMRPSAVRRFPLRNFLFIPRRDLASFTDVWHDEDACIYEMK
jgi:hypothetical protein